MFNSKYNNCNHSSYINQLKKYLNDQSIFNQSINQSRIYITFLCLNIKDQNNNTFGLQKIINVDKFNIIKEFLLSNGYKLCNETIKKSQYENKLRIQINNNDNEYYRTSTLRVDVFNNIIFSELYYQTIEPSQFPNIVKYSKYNSVIFKKNNISISFNLFNFNNQEHNNNSYNIEIVIKKYTSLYFNEKTILELNKIISLINN